MTSQLEQQRKTLEEKAVGLYNSRRDAVIEQAQGTRVRAKKLLELREEIISKLRTACDAADVQQQNEHLDEIEALTGSHNQSLHCDAGFMRFEIDQSVREALDQLIRRAGDIVCTVGLPSKLRVEGTDKLIAATKSCVSVEVSPMRSRNQSDKRPNHRF